MQRSSNHGVLGAVLIGLGCGLTAAGLVLVIPACAKWSLGMMEEAIRRGRESVEEAAATFGQFAGRTQHRFEEAAKTARSATYKAAGAVESAAHKVREYTS
ncbi:MAG: hypothetical protein JOY54_05570 [Acidobacteriaceae bacterium]|nr:hypothetical protein [Acidobacteriaceae bacterium]